MVYFCSKSSRKIKNKKWLILMKKEERNVVFLKEISPKLKETKPKPQDQAQAHTGAQEVSPAAPHVSSSEVLGRLPRVS